MMTSLSQIQVFSSPRRRTEKQITALDSWAQAAPDSHFLIQFYRL